MSDGNPMTPAAPGVPEDPKALKEAASDLYVATFERINPLQPWSLRERFMEPLWALLGRMTELKKAPLSVEEKCSALRVIIAEMSSLAAEVEQIEQSR